MEKARVWEVGAGRDSKKGVERFGISTLVLIYFFIRFINKKYCNCSKRRLTASASKRKSRQRMKTGVLGCGNEKI